MREMFQRCNEIEILDLSNFITSNVEDMSGMFDHCFQLKEIKGIDKFNTTKVKNMYKMFNNCNELKKLNLSNFITINVINMSKMFEDCFELEFLDLSNFNTTKVNYMISMFSKCYALKEVKGINNFNFENIINKDEMFEGCNNLKNCNEISRLNEQSANIAVANVERQLINMNFISTDQTINLQLSGYNTDTLEIIEEILVEKKPELKHKNLTYLANGNVLIKSFTLFQNKIKNNDKILFDENN